MLSSDAGSLWLIVPHYQGSMVTGDSETGSQGWLTMQSQWGPTYPGVQCCPTPRFARVRTVPQEMSSGAL